MNYNLIIIIAALTAMLIFGYLLLACKTSLWPFNAKEEFGENKKSITIDADSEADCTKKVDSESYNDASYIFYPASKKCTITYTPLSSQ